MFASGVATFGFLYCVQPIMPEFSRQFQVSAATSALSLSLPSAIVAFAILFAGPVSNAYGRKAVMSVSLLTSAVLVLLTAVAPTWHSFLVLRALLGLTLGGLPSVAMTYLNEEMHPESIGLGMGLYIGGNAAGGLGGRLITGVLTDYFGWRIGLAAMGTIGSIAAFLFIRSLPPSRHFNRQTLRLRSALSLFAELFGDSGLP
jgi:YNFM family putative membrane transporter